MTGVNKITIAFIFIRILRNSHKHILAIDELVRLNYNVELVFLGDIKGITPTLTDAEMLEMTIRMKTLKEFDEYLEQRKQQKVIFVTNHGYLGTFKELFINLRRHKDFSLLSYHTRAFPGTIGAKKKSLSKRVLSGRAAENAYRIFRRIKPAAKNILPDYFLVSTEKQIPVSIKSLLPPSKIIRVHSDDINEIQAVQHAVKEYDKQRFGVFVDQLLPFAYKQHLEETYVDIYYEEIDKVLSKIKSDFGLDEIYYALHPEYKVYEDRIPFSKISHPVKLNETIPLVSTASLVISHFSTSIGAAVYLNKPLMLIMNERLQKIEKIAYCVNEISAEINLPVFDTNKILNGEIKIGDIIPGDSAYNNYRHKYLKDEGNDIKEHSYIYAINKIVKEKQWERHI